jgi:hypothetical protein
MASCSYVLIKSITADFFKGCLGWGAKPGSFSFLLILSSLFRRAAVNFKQLCGRSYFDRTFEKRYLATTLVSVVT